jgi:DNA-binding LytR/AlgR family response regulator
MTYNWFEKTAYVNWKGQRFMKIALVDDTQLDLAHLKKHLDKYAELFPSQQVEVLSFSNPDDFLRFFAMNPVFEVIILDMVMPFFNGIEVGREIRKTDTLVKIIYTTISPEFAIEAYEVKAYHYLMKPVSEAPLFKALNEIVYLNEKNQHKKISIKDHDAIINLPFSSILYVEVDKHLLYFHLKDQSVISTYATLKEIAQQLCIDDDFMKVHHSFVVNLSEVITLQNRSLLLPNNRLIPISRSQYNEVKSKYIDQMSKKRNTL